LAIKPSWEVYALVISSSKAATALGSPGQLQIGRVAALARGV
jgi:hypothetical protein